MWLIERKTSRNSTMESYAWHFLNTLSRYEITADNFAEEFKTKLMTLKRTNHVAPEHAYRVENISDEKLEVWKLKVDGSNSYLMAVLTKVKNPQGI